MNSFPENLQRRDIELSIDFLSVDDSTELTSIDASSEWLFISLKLSWDTCPVTSGVSKDCEFNPPFRTQPQSWVRAFTFSQVL